MTPALKFEDIVAARKKMEESKETPTQATIPESKTVQKVAKAEVAVEHQGTRVMEYFFAVIVGLMFGMVLDQYVGTAGVVLAAAGLVVAMVIVMRRGWFG